MFFNRIFQQVLPADIPENIVKQIFDMLLEKLQPDNIRLKIFQNKIVKRIDQEITRLKKAKNFRSFNFIKNPVEKIKFSIQIRACFTATYPDMQAFGPLVEQASILGEQRNPLFSFFTANHKLKGQRLLEEIFNQIHNQNLNPIQRL